MSDVQAGTNRVAIQAATGQTYGEAGKQMAAQRAVPMGGAPTDVAQTATPRPVPGTLGALTRPTERPTEPVTAGAPFGAGPGPSMAGIPTNVSPTPGNKQDLVERVRAIYSMYPNPNLMSLMTTLEAG
jgi:hypothetical protein